MSLLLSESGAPNGQEIARNLSSHLKLLINAESFYYQSLNIAIDQARMLADIGRKIDTSEAAIIKVTP